MAARGHDLVMSGAHLAEVWPLIRDHHYLHTKPGDPMFCFAWRRPGGLLGDTGEPVAAISYTAPVNKYFGPNSIELSRLVRAPDFDRPLSMFVAWSLRWLKKNAGLAYCLCYADSSAGHHGGIYQATNFIHVAVSSGNRQYVNDLTGEIVSGRAFGQRRGAYRVGWSARRTAKKYLYVFPLREPREQLLARFGWSAMAFPKPDIYRGLMTSLSTDRQ